MRCYTAYTPLIIAWLAIAALMVSAQSPAPANAKPEEWIRICDVQQGFNYSPKSRLPFGYITHMRIGNVDFTPDLEVVATPRSRPFGKGKSSQRVVAVVSDVHLVDLHNPQSALSFAGRLSVANRKKMQRFVRTQRMNGAQVALRFFVADWLPTSKKGDRLKYSYGVAFSSGNHDLLAQLADNKRDLALSFDAQPDSDVQKPVNHFFSISLVPCRDDGGGPAQPLTVVRPVAAGVVAKPETILWGGHASAKK
jgi:hypothetical protein